MIVLLARRKKLKKQLLFLLLYLIFWLPVFSLNNTEETEGIQIAESNSDNNYEILEAKLEACEKSFDRVNNTYLAALGIIITSIFAFLGITGYNYHKNYKAELTKIKGELEQEYQNKIDELLQKNSKIISDKTECIEHNLKQELLSQRYDLLVYKFEQESNERIKLSLSLKILNTLSEANWGYSDWIFNIYIEYIKDSCSKGILFDYSEVDEVNEMLCKLPDRFNGEKEKLQSIIRYEK